MTGPHPSAPLAPGSTIGILGAGQLGRMLALSAARLGLRVHSFGTSDNDPAAHVSHHHVAGRFDDLDALRAFGEACDVITYEWESIPPAAVEAAGQGRTIAPNLRALKTAQDRLEEKTFLSSLDGVAVAPFKEVGDTIHDFRRAVQYLGQPCVVKTRRGGYDGKGQAIIRSLDDIVPVWEALGSYPLIIEGFVTFSREVSIVAARNANGDFAAYPLTENVHQNHILHTSTAPTAGDDGEPAKIARKIVDALDYVGVIGVEFFDTPHGWRVNEIAPRVHNSGHWTQNAGCMDQFEQHIRAIAGWPLGSSSPAHRVQMTNLIGDEVRDWSALASDPKAFLHFYGKSEARPGRKMGHINRILD